MNAVLAQPAPLPQALSRRSDSAHRRHRIGHHALDPGVLRHFNELIARIDLQRAPLDRDQLASAARELIDDPAQGFAPACIHQRMRRAAAIDRMRTDPEWGVDAAVASVGTLVIDYLRGPMALIPNALPVVGRLDDAILVDAAWAGIADEVRDYLDYCRLRHVEATLRGEARTHFGFTREYWLDARRAELEWIAHCDRVGRSSYLAANPSARFRVS
jgi:uncharacterized membrane protein YkvA (DUF1232 family)